MIAGLPEATPDDAFDLVEAADEHLRPPMELCMQLGRRAAQFRGS